MMGGADVRAVVAAAREDTDRAIRREKALSYELEQARQAINNLKVQYLHSPLALGEVAL